MTKLIHYLLLTVILAGCTLTNPFNQGYTGSPENLTCLEEDLPGIYLLMEEISGARPNQGLNIDSSDPAATTQYIQATGRLDGWENRFMLAEATTELPGFILCQVVTFESSTGAKQALYWPYTQERQPYETDRQIGDDQTVTWVEFTNPSNDLWRDYRVEFIYHNLLGVVNTYAPANIATADYALEIAEKMLSRFENPPQVPTGITPTYP